MLTYRPLRTAGDWARRDIREGESSRGEEGKGLGWTHEADRYSVTPQVLITAAGALHHLLSLAPDVQGARQVRSGGVMWRLPNP